jgi:hypothetical protein
MYTVVTYACIVGRHIIDIESSKAEDKKVRNTGRFILEILRVTPKNHFIRQLVLSTTENG